MPEEKAVQLETNDGIAKLTLMRPDRLNALTRNLLLEFNDALHKAVHDDAVRVISITGAGRGFCAGQDLSERDPRKLEWPLDLEAIQKELFHPIIRTMRQTEKPVVALVNGIAAGAGASIALAADIALASQSAKFAFSFVKVGLSVDAGAGQALVQTLGSARARAILMLGETLSAEEAERLGLIWKAVPDDDFEAEGDVLLSRLAASPRQALASIKKAVEAAENQGFEDYLDKEAVLQGSAGRHPDYAEGVLSFLEKRPADFGKA